jgi:hypothetical protein
MSKRRGEEEPAPAKRGGGGFIGRRREHRFEDVGNAKARLLDSLSAKAHVGGAPTVDDGRVWCPDGWTVMTLRRGANDRSAGAAYHQWYAPDGAKFRSRRAAEQRVKADAERDRLIAAARGSDDAAPIHGRRSGAFDPATAHAAAFARDGLAVMPAPYVSEATVDAAHDAAISFYEAVLRTVRARGLHHELQAGFDVCRERGRGRFDMNPPCLPQRDETLFEGPFAELVHGEADWKPVLRKILNCDAPELIASGVFLSLPGAEAQTYHTDGVHLNLRQHAAPHAVNVFVPLVDLVPPGSQSNGPTEFCEGTHVLGRDAWVKERCVNPAPKAGTAILFDYRLGHRGMGNKSDAARPTLYLTYTNKPGWTDKDNFSRARFKKLGELVGAKPSRAERAAARGG